MAGYLGMKAVGDGRRSRWTVAWIFCAFVCQSAVLAERGELRGQCPLGDFGEILVFLAWSTSLFYLLIGSTYRLSLLGVFTAPLVTVMLLLASVPGMMDEEPERALVLNPWSESHAALSVMSYGAFGLAAIAGVMFMVLNKQLKNHDTRSGLFKKLPPLSTITSSMVRLTGVGALVLTGGIICGLFMERQSGEHNAHLWVAVAVWFAYSALLTVWNVRGMAPVKMALSVVLMFIVSLLVFAGL